MNRLILSCKKATALIVKRKNVELTRKEKIQLFFHRLMCDACRRFEIQNKFIDQILEQHIRAPQEIPDGEEAPKRLKENIISKLSRGS